MTENVTEKLASVVAKISFDDLPQNVAERVKWIFLDSIGCALGGVQNDRAKIALELIKELGGSPQASIIGGSRTSYAQAAFANAELINALDYDYIGPLVSHVSPYVIPSCFSIAERQNSSGKDLILALAVAHEVGGRMGNSLVQANMPKDEPPYYEQSPTYSYTHCVFGAVAGAGKLLEFDVERIRNAFGIAGMSTAVPAGMKWSHTGGPAVMLKYGAWTGWISQLATVAVLVTEKGFTGDKTILDGKWGYWQIVGSPFFIVDNVLEGLGEVWNVTQGAFKPYPCCQCNHAGIDGICNLMEQHKIKPADIDEIVVKGESWLQQPHRMGRELRNPFDIQFTNIFIFGMAPYFGLKPSPAWGELEVYARPEIKAMAEKVKIDLHPQTDEIIAAKVKAGQKPGFRKTIVEIKAKGRKFVTELEWPRGDTNNPMSETELLEKFRNNASYSSLEKDKIDKIIEAVLKLDELENIRVLGDLLSLGK